MMATFAPLSEQPIRLQPLTSNSGFIFYSRRVYLEKLLSEESSSKNINLRRLGTFVCYKSYMLSRLLWSQNLGDLKAIEGDLVSRKVKWRLVEGIWLL